MGLTYIDGTVRNNGEQATVRFLVDSGARYTLLPNDVWQQLGLAPERTQEFILADGTAIQRAISSCQIELPARKDADTSHPWRTWR